MELSFFFVSVLCIGLSHKHQDLGALVNSCHVFLSSIKWCGCSNYESKEIYFAFSKF